MFLERACARFETNKSKLFPGSSVVEMKSGYSYLAISVRNFGESPFANAFGPRPRPVSVMKIPMTGRQPDQGKFYKDIRLYVAQAWARGILRCTCSPGVSRQSYMVDCIWIESTPLQQSCSNQSSLLVPTHLTRIQRMNISFCRARSR